MENGEWFRERRTLPFVRNCSTTSTSRRRASSSPSLGLLIAIVTRGAADLNTISKSRTSQCQCNNFLLLTTLTKFSGMLLASRRCPPISERWSTVGEPQAACTPDDDDAAACDPDNSGPHLGANDPNDDPDTPTQWHTTYMRRRTWRFQRQQKHSY